MFIYFSSILDYQAQFKVSKAEKALAKVEAFLLPAKPASDKETITDEERFMFRKLGLRMQAFLLLGKHFIREVPLITCIIIIILSQQFSVTCCLV